LAVSDLHEYEFNSFEGKSLTGTADEIFVFQSEKVILVQEKKIKTYIPRDIDPEFKKQVERYVAMIVAQPSNSEDNRILAPGSNPLSYAYFGQVIYVDINEKKMKAFTFSVDPIKDVGDLREYIRMFEASDNSGILPPSLHHWLCDYCQFWSACIHYDSRSADWRKYMPPNVEIRSSSRIADKKRVTDSAMNSRNRSLSHSRRIGSVIPFLNQRLSQGFFSLIHPTHWQRKSIILFLG